MRYAQVKSILYLKKNNISLRAAECFIFIEVWHPLGSKNCRSRENWSLRVSIFSLLYYQTAVKTQTQAWNPLNPLPRQGRVRWGILSSKPFRRFSRLVSSVHWCRWKVPLSSTCINTQLSLGPPVSPMFNKHSDKSIVSFCLRYKSVMSDQILADFWVLLPSSM